MSIVTVSRAEDGVYELVLDRPEARNALSIEMCDAIVAALESIDAKADARTVLVRGNGRIFCAGADFAAVSGPGGIEFLPAFERMLDTLARFRLPTIASIHGAALGGGLQLACVCDFRIAAADASLGIPSSRLGIVVNFENVQRLVGLVGPAIAKEILMTARSFSGDEAVTIGLLTSSVHERELSDEALSYARRIAELAPLSVQGAKAAVQATMDHMTGVRRSDPDAAQAIDRLVEQAYRSDDLAEGLKAMAEKRQPRFDGL